MIFHINWKANNRSRRNKAPNIGLITAKPHILKSSFQPKHEAIRGTRSFCHISSVGMGCGGF